MGALGNSKFLRKFLFPSISSTTLYYNAYVSFRELKSGVAC